MKNLVFSLISIMAMVCCLSSCSDDDSYNSVPVLTGVYTGVNASTGDSTTVIVAPTGVYDHVSVKSATQETVIDMTTMMSMNYNTKTATISDQGLGGYTGKVKFSSDGKTATLELSNAQGNNFTASLTKTTFPTSIAGYWFNASTGAKLTVNLYPLGVCDKGTIRFSASDSDHTVVVGSISNYGKGQMYIDNELATFTLGSTGDNMKITINYKKVDYTFAFTGQKTKLL